MGNYYLGHIGSKGIVVTRVAIRDTMYALFRYNITIQDIKLANKLWTNEGLWPGRVLRIPVVEVLSVQKFTANLYCICLSIDLWHT